MLVGAALTGGENAVKAIAPSTSAPPKYTACGGTSACTIHTHNGLSTASADAVLNPLWVWMVHAEVPPHAVYLGGALVLGAIALTAFSPPVSAAPTSTGVTDS